jgi:S-adenosylmethionine-diacylgycerolhomoserine-N-methlytransferase
MIPTNLKQYYKVHSIWYNSTRWTFLFGRHSLCRYFPEIPQEARILDLGCGTGKHLKQLVEQYPHSEIIGLDQSKEMLNKIDPTLRDSIQLIHTTYTKETFKEDYFDLIVCSYSLTMFSDLDEVLQTIQFHLKQTGELVVVDFEKTPFSWFSRWMRKNHVHFEHQLFKKLTQHFRCDVLKAHDAYFGLYRYAFLRGKNDYQKVEFTK